MCAGILTSWTTVSTIETVHDPEQGISTDYDEAMGAITGLSANRFIPSLLIIQWSKGSDGFGSGLTNIMAFRIQKNQAKMRMGHFYR
jgi:hypothetical protein